MLLRPECKPLSEDARGLLAKLTPRGIVVHCSASRWGDAAEVRLWHLANGWSDIGYHGVILNGHRDYNVAYVKTLDGKIEPGRAENVVGSHCKAGGMNNVSLGVCLIGNPGWQVDKADKADPKLFSKPALAYATERQLDALIHYLATQCKQYGLNPKGKFKVGERSVYVLSQHSDHDPVNKPLCASLKMSEIRSLVAERLQAV